MAKRVRIDKKPPQTYEDSIKDIKSQNISPAHTVDLCTTLPRVIRVYLEAYLRDSRYIIDIEGYFEDELLEIIEQLKEIEGDEIPTDNEAIFARLGRLLNRLWY